MQVCNNTQCLKITEKVSFNFHASEASYVYILSGQKFIKNAKNGPFWRVFDKPEACGQTVLPDRSVFNRTKIGGKCQNSNATFWVIFKHCVSVVVSIHNTGSSKHLHNSMRRKLSFSLDVNELKRVFF